MRTLTILVILIAVVFGGAWYAGETWLGNRAAEVVASSPQVNAESVTPLRNPTRLGLHMDQLDYGDETSGFSTPGVDVYAPVTSPNTLTVDLPTEMELRIAGVPTALTLAGGKARASISPTHEMTIRKAGIEAENLAMNGAELFASLGIEAQLVHMGGNQPLRSAGAYDIDIALTDAVVAGLPQALDIDGSVKLWLTSLPGQATLEGNAPPPMPTGFETRDLRFTFGDAEATLIGRIEADAEGYAAGQAAFYTEDASKFIDAAVNAGLIPSGGVMMARALLNNLSGGADDELPETAEDAQTAAGAAPDPGPVAEDGPISFPRAAKGQIRLPLILENGRIFLGPVPIGTAPRLFATGA